MNLILSKREKDIIKSRLKILKDERDRAFQLGDLFTARVCANQLRGINFVLNMAGEL